MLFEYDNINGFINRDFIQFIIRNNNMMIFTMRIYVFLYKKIVLWVLSKLY